MDKVLREIWLFFTCWRHDLEFRRNIYGDEIIHSGRFKRSWWRCKRCGAWKSKEHLHDEAGAAPAHPGEQKEGR
jgi:hypothetical protein